MKRRRTKDQNFGASHIAVAVVALLHLVGAGLLMFSKGFMYQLSLDLVPINLILTALITIKFQSEYSAAFFKFCGAAFLFGFGAELLGVNTGLLFGNYSYGDTLGIKIIRTPLLIGLNWFMLSYGAGSLLSNLKIPGWIKWILATGLMVLFDYFMEPVALKHDFWMWANGNIPVSNYIGWTIVSAIIMAFFYLFRQEKKNPIAGQIWLIQFGFFVLQNII